MSFIKVIFMKKVITLVVIYFWFLVLVCPTAFALTVVEPLSPEQAFKVSAKVVSPDMIQVSWQIADGYYVYRDKVHIESQDPQIHLDNPIFPVAQRNHDENFGEVAIYRNQLTIPVHLFSTTGSSVLPLLVRFHGCADQGVCYPPQKITFNLALSPPVVKANVVKQWLNSVPQGLFEDALLPPDQAFEFFASVKDDHTLHVNWQIAEGYYLYREKFQLVLVDTDGVSLGNYDIPRGTPKQDEAFGQVEIFHQEIGFDVPLIRSAQSAQIITLQVGYQGCADRGVCYPPMSKKIDLNIPVAQSGISPSKNYAHTLEPLSEQDQIVRSLHQDSLLITLLSFFGFGLLLAFTPCIFPMIPILSGIIVGHSHRITAIRGFLLSLSYVLASALTYTVFGVLAALFGSNLQTTFQQPWIVGLFSAIFLLLALSMFGFYQLEIPRTLRLKLHSASDRHRNGSFWGAAIMGMLSSLIVGPCVAAPLAGALIYIGQTGDALLGGSALFMMALGMGVPLLLLGASAGKLLPKSGHWLNTTKSVFGVIMLAVAIWMLSRILPASLIMILWAMLLIVTAIYLSAVDPLPENSSGWRKLWKGLGMMMLAYGLLLLIGFGSGNSNPLKPLQGIGLAVAKTEVSLGLGFERVRSTDVLERLKQAAANHQSVMLDFYADWCVSCKEMEEYTFKDQQVKQSLAGFVLLQVDITDNTEADKALLAIFNLIGPPAVLFFDQDGKEKTVQRVVGYQDAVTFIKSIQLIKS